MDAPAAIALVRTTSLSSLVEAEVMRLILAGELDAGQQIKEVAIAERLGVGRSSVREALRALEAAGMVRTEKNRGAFVRVVSEIEAREMYVVREQLEGLAGELLARAQTQLLHFLGKGSFGHRRFLRRPLCAAAPGHIVDI